MLFKNYYDLDDIDSVSDNDSDSDDSFDADVFLKISDFGISHPIQINSKTYLNSENENLIGKAYIKYRLGTYYYTAPEVLDVRNIF